MTNADKTTDRTQFRKLTRLAGPAVSLRSPADTEHTSLLHGSTVGRVTRAEAGPTPGQVNVSITQEEEADLDTYGNETRILGGSKAAFHRPWHRDKRWWVRWPAHAWHVTGQRFIPRGRVSKYRPASYWWSRWLGSTWRMFQRYGVLTTLKQNYANLLLIFVPAGLAAAHFSWPPILVLGFNFMAIIPLSGLVHLACEDLSAHLDPVIARLLVAFSDNLVELVVSSNLKQSDRWTLVTLQRSASWLFCEANYAWCNSV